MLTDRADEVIWQIFSNVFIAADKALPDYFALRGCANWLWFWFDVTLIIFIGAGWCVRKDCHEGWLADEKSVGSKINFFFNLQGEVGVGSCNYVWNSIFCQLVGGVILGELIHVSS